MDTCTDASTTRSTPSLDQTPKPEKVSVSGSREPVLEFPRPIARTVHAEFAILAVVFVFELRPTLLRVTVDGEPVGENFSAAGQDAIT